jgi:hypothetical protein
MSPELVTLLTFGSFGLLLLAGVPLAFAALATAALVAVTTSGTGALLLLVNRIYDTSMLYVLISRARCSRSSTCGPPACLAGWRWARFLQGR